LSSPKGVIKDCLRSPKLIEQAFGIVGIPPSLFCLRDQGTLLLNDPLSFRYVPSSLGELAFSNHATARFLYGPRGAGAGSAASTITTTSAITCCADKLRIAPIEASVFAKGGAVTAAVWRTQRLRGVWD
jgi:hypothetical protein